MDTRGKAQILDSRLRGKDKQGEQVEKQMTSEGTRDRGREPESRLSEKETRVPLEMIQERHERSTDARIAIVFAAAFAAVVATAQSWWTLGASMVFAGVFLAGRPKCLRRLKVVAPFIVLIWLFVPWNVVWQGTMTPRIALSLPGLELALRTSLRAIAIVLVTASLFDRIRVHELSAAFSRLPLPKRLTRLFTLTMRFLPLLRGELRQLRIAMACRGYPGGAWRTDYRSLAQAMGSLLVRSVDRSERVADAIASRTFGAAETTPSPRWSSRDWAWCFLAVFVVGAFLACEALSNATP